MNKTWELETAEMLNKINEEALIDYCYVYGLDDYWYYFSVGEFDEVKLIKLDYEQLVKILKPCALVVF